jgi:hypothetical protein
MSVSFSYNLTGTGWSQCDLDVDGKTVVATASYLSDALRDLIAAVNRILGGELEATAAFEEEPGEYRWKFFRVGNDRLRIRILWFDHMWSDEPDESGKIMFDVESRLKSFAGALYSGCKRLLEDVGLEGYRQKWQLHEFPVTEYEELARLIKKSSMRWR